MLIIKTWHRILLVVGLVLIAAPALGLSVLLSPGTYVDVEITTRLLELGHTVTESDPLNWDGLFDYSVYDVVAFEFASSSPADVSHLVEAVDAGIVGVVIFRGGSGVEAIASALGLIADSGLSFQGGHQATILANPHLITQNHTPATYDLGYTNTSKVDNPGVDTTILVGGPDGAALVVHNTRRAVVTPFYGHFAGYDNETEVGLTLTDNSLTWAADEIVSILDMSWGSVKTLYTK